MKTDNLFRCRMLILTAVAMPAAWALAAPDTAIYTLYRSSVTDSALRLHVATFDTLEGQEYNRENCSQAQQLFAAQLGVKVTFWCEPGKFRAVTAGDRAPGPGKQFTTGKPVEPTCSPSASKLARSEKPSSSGSYTCPK